MIFLKSQPFPPETYNKWNGGYKSVTKDCEGCKEYYEQESERRCYWGVAWKKLSFMAGRKLRKCQYVGTEGPREKRKREEDERKRKWEDYLKSKNISEKPAI